MLFLGLLALVALVGVLLLANGIIARRRSRGATGVALTIVGLAFIVIPAAYLISASVLRN